MAEPYQPNYGGVPPASGSDEKFHAGSMETPIDSWWQQVTVADVPDLQTAREPAALELTTPMDVDKPEHTNRDEKFDTGTQDNYLGNADTPKDVDMPIEVENLQRVDDLNKTGASNTPLNPSNPAGATAATGAVVPIEVTAPTQAVGNDDTTVLTDNGPAEATTKPRKRGDRLYTYRGSGPSVGTDGLRRREQPRRARVEFDNEAYGRRIEAATAKAKIFKERTWPSKGNLVLKDGIDIACNYCITDKPLGYDFTRAEFADRKFPSTDMLHEHVRTVHIEREGAMNSDVDLSSQILCEDKDRLWHREPVIKGPAIPVLQLQAAEKFGWKAAYPCNKPSAGYVGAEERVTKEDGKKGEDEERQGKSKYDIEVPEPEDKHAGRHFHDPLTEFRDVVRPKLLAYIENPDGEQFAIDYGLYLQRMLRGERVAISGMRDHTGERRLEFQELIDGHQEALVQIHRYKFNEGWVVVKEQWVAYSAYARMRNQKLKVMIMEMRDGIGHYRSGFKPLIEKSRENAKWWLKLGKPSGLAMTTSGDWRGPMRTELVKARTFTGTDYDDEAVLRRLELGGV